MTALPVRGSHARSRLGRALAFGLALSTTAVVLTGTADAAAPSTAPAPIPAAAPARGTPDLGPGVTVFDPAMPVASIQATLDAAHTELVDTEMGTRRRAFLFKPGTYGTATQPLQIKVGYYTEITGLGARPTDVVINGKIETYNRCLHNDGTPNCLALVNFWRTVSNLTLNVNATGQDGCRGSANFWAVSQAVSMRRLNITGGNLSLMDYCTDGPQFASGGFIADSKLPFVVSGSQQQWLTRNTEIEGWSNGVWNQVFAGVVGAPSDATFPDPPYTTLDRTPVSREKPYLFVDAKGGWNVRVPAAQRKSRGVSWAAGLTPGHTVPLSKFHVARPGDPAASLRKALKDGKHLLLTPGIYSVPRSLTVDRAGTIVLGIGHATLTAAGGATPLVLGGAAGTVVAGVTIDAGPVTSKVLLDIRKPKRAAPRDNPVTLSDVYFRVGGPHVGKTQVGLRINADDVLVDHTWVWRADHGIEGFTDTQRWHTNTGRNGVIVNGDRVTATGLFVEHFQQYNTIWNGEDGVTVFYQNELPYDPPTQADWMNGKVEGWAAYKVSNKVRRHNLWGGGVYVFNQNNPQIHTENGFEVPSRSLVRLRHILTVNLSAGVLDHVVNGVGAAADTSRIGSPVFIKEYPTL